MDVQIALGLSRTAIETRARDASLLFRGHAVAPERLLMQSNGDNMGPRARGANAEGEISDFGP